MKEYLDYLINWLRDVVKKANAKGLIVGVSGGIDSAVVACLMKKAFPDNSFGLILPCHSNPIDQELAEKLNKKIGLEYEVVDLSKTFDIMMQSFNANFETNDTKSYKDARSNTKVRLRMTTIYAYAQAKSYLVLGTDNAAEWYIGYFTKHGDGGCDIAPLIHLTKGQVIQAAKELGVIDEIISRPPSAGLYNGQTDEDEIGVSYNDLDLHITGHNIEESKKERLLYLHKISEHKRKLAHHPKSFNDFKK